MNDFERHPWLDRSYEHERLYQFNFNWSYLMIHHISIAKRECWRMVQKSWFGKLLQAIVKAFKPYDETIFWKKRDRNGNAYWQGYDPNRNRSIYLASEDEARIWRDLPPPFR